MMLITGGTFGLPIYRGSRPERCRRDPELVAAARSGPSLAVSPMPLARRRRLLPELAALGVQEEVLRMAPCRP